MRIRIKRKKSLPVTFHHKKHENRIVHREEEEEVVE